MSRTAFSATGALLLSTAVASAGALDRTGQPIGVLFEEGSYAELSYSFTSPDVQGSVAGGLIGSGDVGSDYSSVSLAFKSDLSRRLSLALIFDQPFGADVDYGDADLGYPVGGSVAKFESEGVTALLRYKFNDRWSVHGGPRYVRVSADLSVSSFAPDGTGQIYEADFDSDSDLGYAVGAAYERREIGLRVALTYSSETSFSHGTRYSGVNVPAPGTSLPFANSSVTDYTLPQSVNLDFRTGIAADTAIFGSIRWADWSQTTINVPGPYLGNPVVQHDGDVVTYTIGVGRRFTEQIAASASVIYERGTASEFDRAVPGSGVSNLAPTDGQLGLQLAATYAVTDHLELSGGVRYTRLGDATTRRFGGRFEGNDAVSVGVRVGYRF